jgi:hypothetical protein
MYKFWHKIRSTTKIDLNDPRTVQCFSWDYYDMKGIHLDTCIHHIYTNDQIKPVREPPRRMNLA